MTTIKQIKAREILDSRGNPTLEIDLILDNGKYGRASVPSGASTGSLEALEKRDYDMGRYNGKGVVKLADIVNQQLSANLISRSIESQENFDRFLIELDGTSNKSKIGANAILALSLSFAKAAAINQDLPLYKYLAQQYAAKMDDEYILPVPMINIINGGAHANNQVEIQEFLILPVSAPTFVEAVRYGATVFHALKHILQRYNLSTSVGDEGGFTPFVPNAETALNYIIEAIELSGFIPGEDIYLGLDVASSEFYHNGYYTIGQERYSSQDFVDYLSSLVDQYPLISIEDGMAEKDWDGWRILTNTLGEKVQLVGDDLFVTNSAVLYRGIDQKLANAILIKPNQVGTISETLGAIKLAKSANYNTIVSHRSGETEDTSIADLAVATSAGQIKTGSMCRSDRVAKYNQLLRINEELGSKAKYAGSNMLQRFKLK